MRIRMQGFIVSDYMDRCGRILSRHGRLAAAGKLQSAGDGGRGPRAMPDAFLGLFSGRQYGQDAGPALTEPASLNGAAALRRAVSPMPAIVRSRPRTVSHWRGRRSPGPVRSHASRCAEVPWVKLSGTTRPCASLLQRIVADRTARRSCPPPCRPAPSGRGSARPRRPA